MGEGGEAVLVSWTGTGAGMLAFFVTVFLSRPMFSPGVSVPMFFGKESESEETFMNTVSLSPL